MAGKLGIEVVPEITRGTLREAVDMSSKAWVYSQFGDFLAEGMVLRPSVELKSRAGHRIITKLKHRDF